MRRLGEGERHLRSGAWSGWRPTHMMGRSPHGKTLGIIGYGRIGRAVARQAASALGMHIMYYAPRDVQHRRSGHGGSGRRRTGRFGRDVAAARRCGVAALPVHAGNAAPHQRRATRDDGADVVPDQHGAWRHRGRVCAGGRAARADDRRRRARRVRVGADRWWRSCGRWRTAVLLPHHGERHDRNAHGDGHARAGQHRRVRGRAASRPISSSSEPRRR